MNTDHEKVIELSKFKVLLLTLGACAFVAGGLWMLQLDATEITAQRKFNNPAVVYAIGWVSILFFGLCGVYGFRKMFDSRPGLVLSSAGILDNSSGISAGLIPWSEIVGFAIYEVQQQKMLIVKVSNPEKYIQRGNFLKRALNRTNFKMCGSPIAISSNSLKIRFDALIDSCNQYFDRYGNNS